MNYVGSLEHLSGVFPPIFKTETFFFVFPPNFLFVIAEFFGSHFTTMLKLNKGRS